MAPLARCAEPARVGRVKFLQKKAFLFDLDGTLVDSSALHEMAFRETLRQYAPRLLETLEYEALKGQPTVEAFRALGITGGGELDALVSEKQRRYREALSTGRLRLLAGSCEILEFLRKRRKRLFVVTGGSRRSVDLALRATGIDGFFEGIVTADDVAHGKPSPESYLLCRNRFAIDAADALVIEDSESGLEACRAAGLDAVLVNNPCLEAIFRPAFPTLVELNHALAAEEELTYA